MRGARVLVAGLVGVVLTGCGESGRGRTPGAEPAGPSPTRSTGAAATEPTEPTEPTSPTPTARETASPPAPERLHSDGRPREARLSIPALGLRDLRVVPYRGTTDDAPGTRIQDGGVAASPHGPEGGTGPAGIGNYLVTAHRTSSTRAFADLPALREGAVVHIDVGRGEREVRWTYRISTTRETSFRSARSLARQRAAVPGRPGARPTRAVVTLSTCATPEDHAEGNFWSDEFKNPEHRIDKIGVLVRRTPAP